MTEGKVILECCRSSVLKKEAMPLKKLLEEQFPVLAESELREDNLNLAGVSS